MALDEARGLLYLPTSTPSSDYYGGQRPGANLFAESLVCLDAATGKMKWHFQTVHHGLWDYDNPTQPNLVTITVDGRRIDAVAQVTKHGFTYVFDRVTGEPVWPIVERPVPTDTRRARREAVSDATVSDQAAGVRGQGVSLDDANDLTPESRRGAGADAEVPHRPAVHAAVTRRARCNGRGKRAAPTGAARRSIPRRATCSCGRPRRRREPRRQERRIEPLSRWPTRTCSRAAASTPASERFAADGSALRRARGHRSQQRRHRLAGAAGRR